MKNHRPSGTATQKCLVNPRLDRAANRLRPIASPLRLWSSSAISAISAVFLVLSFGWNCLPVARAQSRTPDGFPLPEPGVRFNFPRDHGSHPDYKIEWWYVTGHLFASNSVTAGKPRRFGFQATFFRRAAPIVEGLTAGSTHFGTRQLFLAHMALLDVATGRFRYEERINRDGWDAASDTNSLAVRNGNWSLRLADSATTQLELTGSLHADARFRLTLVPRKPLVIFGTNGVSRKAAEPWAASHYLTFSRLSTRGNLSVDRESFEVTGEAWMDHEISSSQLGEGQVGWDWACVQLHDGREIMTYRMRRRDGTTDQFSTLAWVDATGKTSHQNANDFKFEPLGHWKSPHTQAVYPAKVRLTTLDPGTGRRRAFTLAPLVADQELRGGVGGIPYWEGACRVRDEAGAEIGQAFLEMTGYAGNLRGPLE